MVDYLLRRRLADVDDALALQVPILDFTDRQCQYERITHFQRGLRRTGWSSCLRAWSRLFIELHAPPPSAPWEEGVAPPADSAPGRVAVAGAAQVVAMMVGGCSATVFPL